MAKTIQGVDVVTKIVDQTATGAASVKRSLSTMARDTEGSLGKAGKQWAGSLGGAIITGLAVAGIDRALEDIVTGVKAGEAGTAIGLTIGEAIIESLRSIPIAGPLGELGGRAVGKFFDIDMDFEERQKALNEERRRLLQGQEVERDAERLKEKLREDTLTEQQKRRKQFEQQLAPILQKIPGLDDRERVREEVDQEFRDRERRMRQEEQRRLEQEAERNRRDREIEEARERERREIERSQAFEAAAGNLATGRSSRFSTGRVEAFQAQQFRQATPTWAGRQITLLEQIFTEAREQRRILEEAAT